MWFFTRVERRSIYNGTSGTIEMVLVVTHIISELESFWYGSPTIILFRILKTWKQSPWTETEINTRGVSVSIMVMLRRVFTGRMVISIGKISKARKIMFNLLILLQIISYVATNSWPPFIIPHNKNRGLGITFKTLI